MPQGCFFKRVDHFICLDKKVCVHNISKNIFRLHPIPYVSCVFDAAVTENPGIKPRNTNVVLKGRHSLLRRRMHGG